MCKKFVEKYNLMPDTELIELIRQNDHIAFETLFYKYLPHIKSIVSKNVRSDYEYDDMFQDATISFYYATQMYDFHSSSFSTFLSLCINRSLKSTIRKASAKKRIPENLIDTIDEKVEGSFNSLSAEQEYFDKSSENDTSDFFKSKLSEFEFRVLKSFLTTESYDATAIELGMSRKSVDNAIQRIKKKIQKSLNE